MQSSSANSIALTVKLFLHHNLVLDVGAIHQFAQPLEMDRKDSIFFLVRILYNLFDFPNVDMEDKLLFATSTSQLLSIVYCPLSCLEMAKMTTVASVVGCSEDPCILCAHTNHRWRNFETKSSLEHVGQERLKTHF